MMNGSKRLRARIAIASSSALISASVVAACNAFSGSGGADGNATMDAGSASDASMADGNTTILDSSTQDGTMSAPDAALPHDAAAGYCVGAEHWLCDDFDRDGGVLDFVHWSSVGLTGSGVLSIVTPSGVAPPSPPNALSASAASDGTAVVYGNANVGGGGLQCDFSFRIDQRGSEEVLLVVVSLYAADGSYYRVQVTGMPDGFSDYSQKADASAAFGSTEQLIFQTGIWERVSLRATIGDAGTTQVTVNGSPRAVMNSANVPLPTASSVSMQLGAQGYGGNTGSTWTVLYDDVVCDLVPRSP